jgi:ribonuclease HI
VRLDRTLREELSLTLKLEEEFWALKSRVGWVVDGDRNTKYFHTSTIIRRRFNKILRLKNSVGDWLENSDVIRDHIQSGFIDLFSTSHTASIPCLGPVPFAPRVSEEESIALETPCSPSEVKLSLWAMKPFKAPGPDGLHPGFFQRCWPQVRDSVTHEVIKVFQNGKMPEYLNSTLIALIPKCSGPETIGQFRPISLCNTVYKMVTKTIVNRIRPLLSHLVSPYQSAFVPGRRGVDNVIIAQELLHSMHRKKGRTGSLILKVDLEKAYDRLEWSFIREVLLFFLFPKSLVDLILDCVSSSSISILLNGGKMEVFKPSRGIRQGDPLSPYLFILCLEYLSLKIFGACHENRWKPIKASRNGPAFSHLFFADDLLLCSVASIECCNTMVEVLEEFCDNSGQKINLSKSKAYFSPNVDPVTRDSLCGILGVSSTPDLGRYLGFPLRSNGRNTRDFNFVVERVQSKLSSWKAKLLSPAGRVVLIQSVTSSIPAYYMQNTMLPSKVCSDLDQLNRDFLWGSSRDSKKMHLVGWDKVCRPKCDGGLGLQSTKFRNIATLAKLNWRLIQDKEALWAKTLLAKYGPTGPTAPNAFMGNRGSSNLRGLRLGLDVFKKGIRWVVNNGHLVSFWHDRWVGTCPIRELIHGPLTVIESSLRVCDVLEGSGVWNFERLSFSLPPSILETIRAIYVSPLSRREDCLAWDSSNGIFCLKKAVHLAKSHTINPLTSHGNPKWIWTTKSSPRICFFLWQCYHKSVPVRDTLFARGINVPTCCPRCTSPTESLSHVLRDCPDSNLFWNQLGVPVACLHSFSFSLVEWLDFNCSSPLPHNSSKVSWQTVFSFAVWNLWLRRNHFAFDSLHKLPDPVAQTLGFASEFFCLTGGEAIIKSFTMVPVKWHAPPLGWAKLNTDGSSLGNPGLAGGGGVIRDSSGSWLGGFSRYLGHTTSVQAELRALKDGLILASDLVIPYLIVEMDSLVAVNLVSSLSIVNVFLSSLVNDCRLLLEKFQQVTINHIYREANKCADILAKDGCSMLGALDFSLFSSPPAHVLGVLDFDLSNNVCNRLVSR